jgi:YesN/AraC family two-component response regulator
VAYLSQLYKDQTGVNFSDDLEKYRMKKAKDLLLNKDLSIEDISARTGYQSATAFRRAFKRVEGISPSEFRSEDHSIS